MDQTLEGEVFSSPPALQKDGRSGQRVPSLDTLQIQVITSRSSPAPEVRPTSHHAASATHQQRQRGALLRLVGPGQGGAALRLKTLPRDSSGRRCLRASLYVRESSAPWGSDQWGRWQDPASEPWQDVSEGQRHADQG
eukprot:GHVL01028733.1.p2 GENE.GHVL01028733.1~~GHVL01028733.1.p2  ORF type:complete len:138 (-),score=11.18 GHVL01028733.1:134-547(-)